MRYRRLIDQLRQQNWMAVAIDLVIVVVGVFIGIQVANWNEDRATQRKADVFTLQLRADLLEEAWAYERQIDYDTSVRDSARRAADALSGTVPLPDEALLINAYRATQYSESTRRRATYDELTSTGSISLITDRKLRVLAMSVYSARRLNDIGLQGERSEYRRLFRMRVPQAMQATLAEKCGDRVIRDPRYDNIALSLAHDCSTGLPAAELAESAAILRADPDMLPTLRLRLAEQESLLLDFTTYLGLREGLQALAAETP